MIVENIWEPKVFYGVWMCLKVFGREIRDRRERICPKSSFLFLQNEGFSGIYGPWHAFWGLVHLVGTLVQADDPTRCAESTRLTSTILSFSHFSTLAKLGVFGKLWFLVSRTLTKLKIWVESKVIASRSVLTHFARFSRYLNNFNYDFDPWMVVGKVIC